MIRKDANDKPFGDKPQTQTPPAEQDKTFVETIKDKVAERSLEIDGVSVGPVAAKLIRQHEMELIGSQVLQFAIVKNTSGAGIARTSREPYNPAKHSDCQTETVVREYLLAPADASGHKQIHLVANNVHVGAIGLTLARRCLLRCALTSVGEAMLAASETTQPVEAMAE